MDQISRSFEFSIDYQRAVLSRILQDKDFAIDAKRLLQVDHFDSAPFKWIYRKIAKGEISTVRTLTSELRAEKEKEKISEDLRRAIVEEAKLFLNKKDFEDAEYGLKKVDEFIQTQELSDALLTAATNLKEGRNISRIKEKLVSVVITDKDDPTVTVDPIKTKEERFTAREQKVKNDELIFIPTGIKALDDDIRGICPGLIWSFFGDTNIGKSAFAVNIGRSSIINGYKTWHIVTEDTLDLTLQRYDASFSKIVYDRFTFCDYTKEEKERVDKIFKLLESKRKDYLLVTKMDEGITMADIGAEYQRIKAKHHFYPILILIDSPHNMEPTIRRESTRLNYKQIYQEARGFTRKENLATILFDQSNQASKGKIADTSAASESYDKPRIVDGFITINQKRIHKKEGIIILSVVKMKDRRKGIEYTIRPRMSIMRLESIKEEE